ncbi:unnamed protein product [Linum tenue]|uniref:Uncharacterized protein n=1 Tax=Linum tenue TaxID=586396 RepID=A0AAV0NTU0_9ROSI|nr:unnamed protein product [Linum tenue]
MVGGSILGAFLQVLFDRIASREVLDFFRGQKLSVGLLQKLNTMLIYVSGVLDDAEEKQITKPSVKLLLLMGCLGVESFPGKRLLPSTLTILKIWDFPSLTSLDWEGLQNLHSLRELQICNCPNLKCLPEEGFPLNLSHLYVSWCPLLEQRCRPDDGEDWPKIAHIPELEINFQKITTLEPSA